MIRVMIVDDEPYIRQGIKILINWEQYGFEICGEAANGKEAVELMKNSFYDLIITDIKMPQMDGLELVQYTWENISKKIRFIILSGFYEFEFAKKAIKYDVADYVLKPIQKEELIHALEGYKEQYYQQMENQKMLEYSEKIVFDRHVTSLLLGKYDNESINYMMKYLSGSAGVRYISIDYDTADSGYISFPAEEQHKARRLLYDTLKIYLGKHWYHAYLASDYNENDSSVGFIYIKELADELNINEKVYISRLYDAISAKLSCKIILYIGQKTDNIRTLSESYKSVAIAKAFQLFSNRKDIAYYDEIQNKINPNRNPADKDLLDELIRAIEQNDTETINQKIEIIYEHFKEFAVRPDIIKINLDYLLFSLINLAKELDSDYDQEEAYKMISQGGYEQIAVRGSVIHFKNFALDFASYLDQLRQHAFGGVLIEIEKEICEHYMENLSLKSLSEKYYINSAYLGQIFKKKYGNSFKDYLNTYRIERAAEMLIRSDDKIYLIANAAGFNNTDYFISKFVQLKGVTPLQYRKQLIAPKNNL